jgi:hypothetical protein
LLGDHTRNARRQDAMARHDDATWLTRVLENIMAAPVAYDPSIAMQSRDDLGALRLGLGHDSSFRRKHMRISVEFNFRMVSANGSL